MVPGAYSVELCPRSLAHCSTCQPTWAASGPGAIVTSSQRSVAASPPIRNEMRASCPSSWRGPLRWSPGRGRRRSECDSRTLSRIVASERAQPRSPRMSRVPWYERPRQYRKTLSFLIAKLCRSGPTPAPYRRQTAPQRLHRYRMVWMRVTCGSRMDFQDRWWILKPWLPQRGHGSPGLAGGCSLMGSSANRCSIGDLPERGGRNVACTGRVSQRPASGSCAAGTRARGGANGLRRRG